MAGRLKTKTGRRAPLGGVDRTLAREWVDLYRQAQQAPGGRVCLNPDDEPEIQQWIDAADPGPLLMILENFAEQGTFEQVGEDFDSIRLLPLLNEYRTARHAGEKYGEVLDKLGEKYGLSPRQISRKVSTDKT